MMNRIESDLLGEREVPADAYYGIHTVRAAENFRITGIPISTYPDLLVALASVKQAAAVANAELGVLDPLRKEAIVRACVEVREGKLWDQFIVDVIQGGAGTSTNMNTNEVICNRALEIMGHGRGEYAYLHPLDHVNLSQSTNDVYPTAVRIALWMGIQRLMAAIEELRGRFLEKARAFSGIVKLGRTQLQDAVPMTLGQEFSAFAVMLEEDLARLTEVSGFLLEINLGATAIGTGINTPSHYAQSVLQALRAITKMDLHTSTNLVEATQDCGVFLLVSGVLKRIAAKLSKTCNDLRLLSSGPRGGLGEIHLPAVQAGSSIMPGKVNPVIPEAFNQIAFEVFGNDVTVTFAAEAGQLQLNAFEPIIGYSLFRSIKHLTNGCSMLGNLCVKGIEANPEKMRVLVERSTALATALNPVFGYKVATSVAAEAQATDATVREVVLRRKLMTEEELDHLLCPNR